MVTEAFPGATAFPLDAPHRDYAIRGRGGVLGWYVGENDGLPRRLPVHPLQRDRYESGSNGHVQRLIFKRDWGTYSPDGELRFLPDGRTITIPLESKYEQLERLAAHFPDARTALQVMYAPRPAAHEISWTCACGMTFTREFAIRIHKEACAAYQEDAAPKAPVTAKPAVPVQCRKPGCSETFETSLQLAQHTRRAHPKAKKRQ